jgi:putative hemolysin
MGIELFIIPCMLLLNALFASYEIALTSLARARVSVLAQEHRRGAAAALFMKQHIEGSLAVVQVGITLVGAIAAAFGGAGVDELLSPWVQARTGLSSGWSHGIALMLFILPLSGAVIVLGELVPKMIAIRKPERVVLALSPMMRVFGLIIYPVVRTFEWLVTIVLRAIGISGSAAGSADRAGLLELRAAATLARSARLIGPLQERIVHAATQMSSRVLRDIMLDADDIVGIPEDARLTEALILAHQFMHTRFPVFHLRSDRRTVQGYVNFKDIVTALKINPDDPTIHGILRPIDRLPDTTTLADALDHMTRRKEHIAIVSGAGGAVAGMVTLEDIIEDLVGDIEDEYDRLPTHIAQIPSGWIMGGGVAMSLVMSTVGIPWTDTAGAKALTLADWCDVHQDEQLVGGEHLITGGLSIHVRKVRRRRLQEAIVAVAHGQPAAPHAPA